MVTTDNQSSITYHISRNDAYMFVYIQCKLLLVALNRALIGASQTITAILITRVITSLGSPTHFVIGQPLLVTKIK